MSIALSVVASYLDLRERYTKLERRAKDQSSGDLGVAREAKIAAQRAAEVLRQVQEMEEQYPDIRKVAARVLRAVEGAPDAATTGPRPGGGLWDVVLSKLEEGLRQGAERVADGVAGELAGAGRFDTLDRGEYDLRAHECAADQVCLEIRVRKADMVRVGPREAVLDAIEAAILRGIR